MTLEVRVDRWDLLALVGVVLLGIGLAMLKPWLGVTVTGVVLLVAGVAGGALPELATMRAQARAAAAGGRH